LLQKFHLQTGGKYQHLFPRVDSIERAVASLRLRCRVPSCRGVLTWQGYQLTPLASKGKLQETPRITEMFPLKWSSKFDDVITTEKEVTIQPSLTEIPGIFVFICMHCSPHSRRLKSPACVQIALWRLLIVQGIYFDKKNQKNVSE
jgi:hypothetical protein